jgi:hypothetical protein
MTSAAEADLVDGRGCGECTACCIDLNIDTPELVKLSDQACPHCTGAGCGIHERRPSVCRDFYCGWRQIPWLTDAWRPDRIGIMLRFLDPEEACPDEPDAEVAISFDLRQPDRQLIGIALAEACGALIEAGIPTFLTVPGAPGHAAGRVHLNVPLAPVLATRNAEAIVRALNLAFDSGLRHVKEPVRFCHRAEPAG